MHQKKLVDGLPPTRSREISLDRLTQKEDNPFMGRNFHSHSGITLTETIVVLVLIGILMALMFPAVLAMREAARRLSCQYNLRQQGIAAQGYHLNHNEFPAESYYDGTPAYGDEDDEAELDIYHASYRVRLLPFMGQAILHDVLGLTASSKGIEDLSRMSIPTFLCPSAAGQRADIGSPMRYASHYYGIAGALGKKRSGEQYPTDPLQKEYIVDIRSLDDTTAMTGTIVLGPFAHSGTIIVGGGVSIASITDGTTNTFLVGEISWKGYEAHRNWVRGTAITSRYAFLPDGTRVPFPYTQLTSAKGVGENFPINIGKQQDKVVQDFVRPRRLESNYEEDMESGTNAIPWEFLPIIVPVRGRGAGHGISGFGSDHVAGANFGYVDGTVRFLNEETATSVLMSLATRNGGEVPYSP
jgi:hypothetical protein